MELVGTFTILVVWLSFSILWMKLATEELHQKIAAREQFAFPVQSSCDRTVCFWDNFEGNCGVETFEHTHQVIALVYLWMVMSKGKQKFLEAHGLEQWWSADLEYK